MTRPPQTVSQSIARPPLIPPALRLGDVLRVAAGRQRFGDKTALIWGEQRCTYAELNALANRAAHALQALGVRRGERVALLARNCPEYVWLYFALAKLGAVLVPVSFWYRSGEIEYTLRQSGTTTFLYEARFAPQATAALQAYGDVRHVVVWGQSPGRGAAGEGVLELGALMADAPAGEPDVPATAADQHIILYTSGTTGFPKGAVFSQGAHYLHALAWALMTGQHAEDVGLLVYPLFHTGGPDCVLLPHFLVGASVVLLDGADPAAMLGAIERHRATNVFCVPTVWRRLLAALQGGRYDVASVRRCLGSSDTLPADLLDAILHHFDAEVYVTYGLTEAGWYPDLRQAHRPPARDKSTRWPAASLVGADRAPLEPAPGHGADLTAPATVMATLATMSARWLPRGPTLMDGYWDLPEKTAESWPESWLRTGDLGYFDSEGYLYLAGRAKDMIVSGGKRSTLWRWEKLLRTLPGVGDVALISVPDREWGESVLACVVRSPSPEGRPSPGRPSRTSSAGAPGRLQARARAWSSSTISPMTGATGKVQKGVLRDRFLERYLQEGNDDTANHHDTWPATRDEQIASRTWRPWCERRTSCGTRSGWALLAQLHLRRAHAGACAGLARTLGRDEGADARAVEYAATLHDVTKSYDGEIIVGPDRKRVLDENGYWKNATLPTDEQSHRALRPDGPWWHAAQRVRQAHRRCPARRSRRAERLSRPGRDQAIREHLMAGGGPPSKARPLRLDTIDANIGLPAFYRNIQISLARTTSSRAGDSFVEWLGEPPGVSGGLPQKIPRGSTASSGTSSPR